VERAALHGRLTWRLATVAEIRTETAQAKTLVLDVPGWPGHLPGQHVDVRLTAEDGYQAERSYSIASAPENPALELTVERIDDGEVSPYLTGELRSGDTFELRGPIGGYFVWHLDHDKPLLLIAGGSGLVPLMSMLRHRRVLMAGNDSRLLLSARTFDDVLYRDELLELRESGVAMTLTLTRAPAPPTQWADAATRRIDRNLVAGLTRDLDVGALIYICGPTTFAEVAAEILVELGRDPQTIRIERFGPTGG
jgi:ferredoxin-NADP reductase